MSTKTHKSINPISEHAQDLSDAAHSLVSDLKTEASNRLDGWKDKAQSHLSDAQDSATDAYDTLKGLIKKHPLAAVGVGVAAGLVLSALLRRR